MEALYLSTQITVIHKINSLLLVGNGRNLCIYSLANGERLTSCQVFTKVSIRGIANVQQDEETEVLLIVWGQRSFSLLKLNSNLGTSCTVVSEQICEDWIVAGCVLDSQTSENGSNYVEFALLTAHSTLLLYSFGKFFEKVDPESKSIYQILEGKDVPNLQSYPLLCVKKRVKCEEQCILFSGDIVVCPISNSNLKTSENFCIEKKWEKRLVCFGGTAFGDLIIWTLMGEADFISPIHRISAHKGVIFSIHWCHQLGLLSTTSDDRLVRVWKVIFPSSGLSSHSVDGSENTKRWECSKINLFSSHEGHCARVWKSLIVPNVASSDVLLSVGEDSKLYGWDLSSNQQLFNWRVHDGASVWSIQTTNDGEDLIVITSGSDGSVKKWSLNMLVSSSQNTKSAVQFGQVGDLNCISNCSAKHKIVGEDVSNANNSFVRSLCLMSCDECIVCLDNGEVWLWRIHSNSEGSNISNTGQLLGSFNEKLSGYSIIESLNDSLSPSKLACVGGLLGHLFIVKRIEEELSVEPLPLIRAGKIFTLAWLNNENLLVCYSNGVIILYKYCSSSNTLSLTSEFSLPHSRQRWFTSACFYILDVEPEERFILIGDRSGSLYLFDQRHKESLISVRGVHGNGGVMSVQRIGTNSVVSTGRDGYVRTWCLVKQSGKVVMKSMTASRAVGGAWISRICQFYDDRLILSFHDIYLNVYSEKLAGDVARIECGGGHRYWDAVIREKESQKDLLCVFLKDGGLCCVSVVLNIHLKPLVCGLASKTIQSCSLLKSYSASDSVFVLGGEDNALRLVHKFGDGSCSLLTAIHSHISAIRSTSVFKSNFESDYIWFLSCGGRAQMKIWKFNHSNYSRCLDASGAELCSQLNNSDIECCEVLSHSLMDSQHKGSWKNTEVRISPETRHMASSAIWCSDSVALIVVASSDAVIRIFQFSCCVDGKNRIDLIEEIKGTHCYLTVDVKYLVYDLPNGTKSDLVNFIIRSTDTAGNISYFYLENYSETPISSTSFLKLKIVKIASSLVSQAGINSISSQPICYYELAELSTFSKEEKKSPVSHSELILMGGDDNEICLNKMVMQLRQTEETVKPNIIVTCLAKAIAHCSQITGLEWIDKRRFLSTSTDQKIISWQVKCCDSNSERSVSLIPLQKLFTSVADVHGMTILNGSLTESVEYLTHCETCEESILVNDEGEQVEPIPEEFKSVSFALYGAGLEIFTVDSS